MGTTYRAYDNELKRDVVLKVIRADLTDDVSLCKRFSREVQAIAKLSHPGIIKIFDFQNEKGLSFYSMEFIEGKSLAEKIKERTFAPQEATEFMVKVIEAIVVVHEAGILHRDIKPDNILLTAEGLPVIIDFGLANFSEDATRTRLTRTGQIVGTFNFVPPEIIVGLQEKLRADERGDVYQLGVVFYQMVTGELPYSNRELLKLLRTTDLTPPQLPSAFADDADDNFDKLVMKSLEIDPQLRYATAKEFHQTCLRWLRKATLPKKDDATNAVTKVTVQKEKAHSSILAAALAIAFIMLALVLSVQSPRQETREQSNWSLKDAAVKGPRKLLIRFDGNPRGECSLFLGQKRLNVNLAKGKQLSKSTFGLEIKLDEPLVGKTKCKLSVGESSITSFLLDPSKAINKELEVIDTLAANLTKLYTAKSPARLMNTLGLTKEKFANFNVLLPKLIGHRDALSLPYEKRFHPLFVAEMLLLSDGVPWTSLTKLLDMEFRKGHHVETRPGFIRIYDEYLIKSIRDKENKERRRESLWFTHQAQYEHLERTGFRAPQQSAHTYNLMSTSVGGVPLKRKYVTKHELIVPLKKFLWTPKRARLSLTFQGWDKGLYFLVTINGSHPIPVYFTSGFGYMLSAVAVSFPIAPKLLKEGENLVHISAFAAPETQKELEEVSLIWLTIDASPK